MSWLLLLCTIASSQEICEIRGRYQVQQDCEKAAQYFPVRYGEYHRCEKRASE